MATLAKTPRSTMITLASTSSGPFILTFRLFDADTIRVYRNGEVETGYTLDATFDDGYTDSASITLDVAGEPGDVIIIDSDLNPHRAQDYLRGDPNIVDKLNIELARIWAAIRDTRQKADRSLRSFQDEEPVSGEAGQVLMIGENGFDAGPTADEVSAAQGYAESAAESAATAALLAEALETAAYGESIPFYVAAAPQTIALPTGTIVDSVFISGLAQQRGASWTQSGNVLTINEPGAIGMYGWYRYRIMEGEFAGQSNTFNGRSAAVAAANGVAWPAGSIIGDGTVEYRYAGAPVVGIADMPGWVPHGDARPEHWAANTSPGSTDMTTAVQAAVNYSGWARLRRQTYAVASEIVVPRNGGIIGESYSFQQFRANPLTEVSRLLYIGAGGANTAVVRVSSAPVGTKPVYSSSEVNNLTNVKLSQFMVDGNDLAEFGIYGARCGFSIFERLVATKTVKRGLFFGEVWSCRVAECVAMHNLGTGFSAGEDLFGWSGGNIVNAVQFDTILTFKNGRSKNYREDVAPKDGVGIINATNRTCVWSNIVAELNYGAGVYQSTRTGPSQMNSLYLEDNCHYNPDTDLASATSGTAMTNGHASHPWGLVVHVASSNLMNEFDDIFCAAVDSPTRYQFIRVTAETSGGIAVEPLEPIIFRNAWGVRGIDSAVYSYALEYPQSGLIAASVGDPDLLRCLPRIGVAESIGGPLSTLYAGNTATGDKSGRNSSNLIALADALSVARVCSGVAVINVSAMTATSSPSSSAVFDGTGTSRQVTIDGGATGRINASSADSIALRVSNCPKLTIQNMAVLERVSQVNSRVIYADCPIIRTGSNASADAALTISGGGASIAGTTAINVSTSTAAVKKAVAIERQGAASFDAAASGTLAGFTAGHAITFRGGGGIATVSVAAGTAAWAGSANITRDASGGAGVVIAGGAVNP